MKTIALHHILLKSPLLAEDLLKELNMGANFEDLAREYSCCPSKDNQGFAGFHHIDQLPTALVRALFSPEEPGGNYLGPIATEFGFHILKPAATPQRSLLLDN